MGCLHAHEYCMDQLKICWHYYFQGCADYVIYFNWPTVYHPELEVFSQSSLCFMSVLGGGTDIFSYGTQEAHVPPGTNPEHPAILGESQLFQPFLLPHCYAVKPFDYGDEYKYEIVPGGADYSGA